MLILKLMTCRFLVFLALAGLLFSTLGTAQPREETASPIRIKGYTAIRGKLEKPVLAKDIEGIERTFERAYVITLQGDFPRDRNLGMRLFIGNYQVPEYGGTAEGLYFKLYDPKLIRRLDGQEISYRLGSEEIKGTKIRFSIKRIKSSRGIIR